MKLKVLLQNTLSIYWACLVTQMVKNLPATGKMVVQELGREDPLGERMATHSSILYEVYTSHVYTGLAKWFVQVFHNKKKLERTLWPTHYLSFSNIIYLVTLFSWAPKSLQMVTAATKLKDTCSLEENLWPT